MGFFLNCTFFHILAHTVILHILMYTTLDYATIILGFLPLALTKFSISSALALSAIAASISLKSSWIWSIGGVIHLEQQENWENKSSKGWRLLIQTGKKLQSRRQWGNQWDLWFWITLMRITTAARVIKGPKTQYMTCNNWSLKNVILAIKCNKIVNIIVKM